MWGTQALLDPGALGAGDRILWSEGEDQLRFGGHGLAVDGGRMEAPGHDGVEGDLVELVAQSFDEGLADYVAKFVELHVNGDLHFGCRQQSTVGDRRMRREDGEGRLSVFGIASVSGRCLSGSIARVGQGRRAAAIHFGVGLLGGEDHLPRRFRLRRGLLVLRGEVHRGQREPDSVGAAGGLDQRQGAGGSGGDQFGLGRRTEQQQERKEAAVQGGGEQEH